jgi:uncharacterized protein YxeA
MKNILKIISLFLVTSLIIFIYFYYNYQFWTHYKTDNFETLVEISNEKYSYIVSKANNFI